MIDRKIVAQKVREFEVQEYIQNHLQDVGLSKSKLQLTPLGEKIVVFTSRPGLIVGRKGQSIKKLTQDLKREFKFEHPQIEISEVEVPNLDPHIVGERIANSLERFGINRFKGIVHKAMEDVMGAGALGIEIHISGKVPSSRAKTWRFYQGYMKKCGEFALQVRHAYAVAQLKSGVVGVQVAIMPSDIELPDDIEIKSMLPIVEEVKGTPQSILQSPSESSVGVPSAVLESKPKRTRKRKATSEEKVKAEETKETNKATSAKSKEHEISGHSKTE